VKEKGAGVNPAPLGSGLIVLLRFAEDDGGACGRKQIVMQGQALTVLVFPCRADAGPAPRSTTCQAISARGVVSRCGAFFVLFLP